MKNSTTRFSDRVENYVKFRPHYPNEIIGYLKSENILKDNYVIADIGSGTGISAELFLQKGNNVFGVEPNKEMREAGEKILSGYSNFMSVKGTAESTTLEDKSIDLIISAQAFHWFDTAKAKSEFKRILKNGRYAVLIWNSRKLNSTPFSTEYEKLLIKYGTDYKEVRHENTNDTIFNSFFDSGYIEKEFQTEQVFDFEGIKGRLLSSSYAPVEADQNYSIMLKELHEIYSKYADKNKVKIEYDTKLVLGVLHD